MLRERTKAGLDAARQEGRVGGRRSKLSDQQQSEICRIAARGFPLDDRGLKAHLRGLHRLHRVADAGFDGLLGEFALIA
jgi:DNA invertase Pin-like site-specific DNA recombinase